MVNQDDIQIDFDTTTDGDEITLKMKSRSGKRITQREYILELEMYLSELARAHNQRVTSGVELQ